MTALPESLYDEVRAALVDVGREELARKLVPFRPRKVLTSGQAAAVLGVSSPNTVTNWLEAGQLPGAHRTARGHWRCLVEEVEEVEAAAPQASDPRRSAAMASAPPGTPVARTQSAPPARPLSKALTARAWRTCCEASGTSAHSWAVGGGSPARSRASNGAKAGSPSGTRVSHGAVRPSWRSAIRRSRSGSAATWMAARLDVRRIRMPAAPRVQALENLAVSVFLEGAVGESLATVLAAHRLRHATDPAARAALTRIVEDEAQHAELAWATLRWCCQQGGDAVRRALETALAELPVPDASRHPVAGVPAHGLPGRADAARALAEGIVRVVRPALASVLRAETDDA